MKYKEVGEFLKNLKSDWRAGKRLKPVVYTILLSLLALGFLVQLGAGLKALFPHAEAKPYLSTQVVYENLPEDSVSFVDLDGRGQLVPLYPETIKAAIDFGKKKGEEGKIYRYRVVVMALDPSTRYVKSESGISVKNSFDPKQIYTFYLPNGQDILNEKVREHVVSVGDKQYRVVLLTIDGRDTNRLAYTFRIEEIIK